LVNISTKVIELSYVCLCVLVLQNSMNATLISGPHKSNKTLMYCLCRNCIIC